MFKSAIPFLLATFAVLTVSGCGKKSPVAAKNSHAQSPEAFLMWSMDKYHKAKAFSATCTLQISSQAFPVRGKVKRQISYKAPNRYKVVSIYPDGSKVVCVSSGKKEINYSKDPKVPAILVAAPTSISEDTTVPLADPTIGGSLLYRFFAGSGDISMVEQPGSSPATWGQEGRAPSGERTKSVKFFATGSFGNVKVVIGVKTGLVYKIAYDSAPSVQALLNGHSPQEIVDDAKAKYPTMKPGPKRAAMKKLAVLGPSALTINGIETYDHPKFKTAAMKGVFDAVLPTGYKLAPPPPNGKPPVPFGKPAPDIAVKNSKGQVVKLSSLRGHVVLIDFWATWCQQCMDGLPVTSALASHYAPKGLKVLAVSADPPAKIAQFVAHQSYKLPAYSDPNQAAAIAFHVDPLPTTVVIDAKGNLVDYMTGPHEPMEIEGSLIRAGLKAFR